MPDPVTYPDLIAYASGDLTQPEASRVSAALAADPEAAATVARYRMTRTAAATDDGVTPPPASVARAKAAFRDHLATAPGASWIDRVGAAMAELIFDSRLQPLAVRAAGTAERIHLAFQADAAQVDLQATPRSDAPGTSSRRWQVMGQVNGDDAIGITVAVTAAGGTEPIARTETDARAAFELAVPSGAFDLHLRFANRTVVLPDIRIGI